MGPQKLAKFFPLESLCLRTPNPEMLVDRARDYIVFIYTMELFCPTSYSTNLVTHWRNIVFLVHAVLATLWSDAPASLQGLSLSFSLSLSLCFPSVSDKQERHPSSSWEGFSQSLPLFCSGVVSETNFVPGSRIRFISMPHISWVEKEKEMPLLQSLPDAACNSNRVINKDCVS
jgi:hypothetical protein